MSASPSPGPSGEAPVQFLSFSSKRNRTSLEKFGTGIFMYDGFSYRLDKMLKKDPDTGSYRCTDPKCRGRAKINRVNGLGHVIRLHNHVPCTTEAQVRLARDALEAAARNNPDARPGDTVVQETVEAIRSGLSEDVLEKTPSSEVFKRTFQRSIGRRNPKVEKKRNFTNIKEGEAERVQFISFSSKKNRTSAEKFGTGIFMYEGFSYRLDKMLKKANGVGSYRCIDSNCKGRARINAETGMGYVVLEHNHQSEPEAAQLRLARDVLEAAARTTSSQDVPVRATVEAIRNTFSGEGMVPSSSDVLMRTFHRARKRRLERENDVVQHLSPLQKVLAAVSAAENEDCEDSGIKTE